MCGIVGIVSKEEIDRALMSQALQLIRHRGPDDEGVAFFDAGNWKVALGNRRLSIIDLSPRGHQPMSNEGVALWTSSSSSDVWHIRALSKRCECLNHGLQGGRQGSDPERTNV